MVDDRALGGGILIGSIAGIIVYFWLLFMSPWAQLTLQVSALAAVGAVLLIMAWIGYTLATTPPPMPIEDFDFDSDLDEGGEKEGSDLADKEKETEDN